MLIEIDYLNHYNDFEYNCNYEQFFWKNYNIMEELYLISNDNLYSYMIYYYKFLF